MKTLFQTGTPITASNLNLAHLANSKPGILSGCSVYQEDDYIIVSKGCVQFSDGTIVFLDGTDKIQKDTFPSNEYTLYIIRYGNDFSIELKFELPEYEYIPLAKIIITQNDIDIIDEKKSNEIAFEKIIEGPLLNPSYLITDNIGSIVTDIDKSSYTTSLCAKIEAGIGEGKIYIPFVYPNFNITKIRLNAELSSDSNLTLRVIRSDNGEPPYTSEVISQKDFVDDTYVFNLQNKLKDCISGNKYAICLTIGQTSNEENTENDIKMYSITLQT